MIAVLFSMVLARLSCVMRGVRAMARRRVGVMCRGFVIVFFVMLRRIAVMFRCLFVVFGCAMMIAGGVIFRHAFFLG